MTNCIESENQKIREGKKERENWRRKKKKKERKRQRRAGPVGGVRHSCRVTASGTEAKSQR